MSKAILSRVARQWGAGIETDKCIDTYYKTLCAFNNSEYGSMTSFWLVTVGLSYGARSVETSSRSSYKRSHFVVSDNSIVFSLCAFEALYSGIVIIRSKCQMS